MIKKRLIYSSPRRLIIYFSSYWTICLCEKRSESSTDNLNENVKSFVNRSMKMITELSQAIGKSNEALDLISRELEYTDKYSGQQEKEIKDLEDELGIGMYAGNSNFDEEDNLHVDFESANFFPFVRRMPNYVSNNNTKLKNRKPSGQGVIHRRIFAMDKTKKKDGKVHRKSHNFDPYLPSENVNVPVGPNSNQMVTCRLICNATFIPNGTMQSSSENPSSLGLKGPAEVMLDLSSSTPLGTTLSTMVGTTSQMTSTTTMGKMLGTTLVTMLGTTLGTTLATTLNTTLAATLATTLATKSDTTLVNTLGTMTSTTEIVDKEGNWSCVERMPPAITCMNYLTTGKDLPTEAKSTTEATTTTSYQTNSTPSFTSTNQNFNSSLKPPSSSTIKISMKSINIFPLKENKEGGFWSKLFKKSRPTIEPIENPTKQVLIDSEDISFNVYKNGDVVVLQYDLKDKGNKSVTEEHKQADESSQTSSVEDAVSLKPVDNVSGFEVPYKGTDIMSV